MSDRRIIVTIWLGASLVTAIGALGLFILSDTRQLPAAAAVAEIHAQPAQDNPAKPAIQSEREFLLSLRKECMALLRQVEKNMWKNSDSADDFENGAKENGKDVIWEMAMAHNDCQKEMERLEAIIEQIEDRLAEIR